MSFNISDVSTTKMTSKGQVVIPEEIREYMNLKSGVKFLVMATTDSIIFKKIHPIPQEDINELLEKSHALAKEHGITENDIEQAILDVRKARKKNKIKASEFKEVSVERRKVAARSKKSTKGSVKSKRRK